MYNKNERKKNKMANNNKMSIWAVIILVATIISLALLITSVVVTCVGIPAVTAAARQSAIDQGVPEAEIQLVISLAVGAVIVALVFASIFDVLKIIGGFMFSLKGRWGVFCIVVAILSAVGAVWTMISNISNKAGAVTIVVDVITLVVNVVLVVACFKHRAEVKGA